MTMVVFDKTKFESEIKVDWVDAGVMLWVTF